MDSISPLFLAILSTGKPIRMDGVTYFLCGGKVRICKSKRGPKKSRSEGEKKSSTRFTEIRKMWRIYRRAIKELPIWPIMARETGVAKSDSLFHSTNGGCIRPGEGVWAFKTFRFSVGTLDAPVITGAEREGCTMTLRWENGPDYPKASASDEVYVGYFYQTMPRSPQLLRCSSAHRGDGQVVLEIPLFGQPEGTPLHLYLFFGSKEADHFSPSEYVEV